MKLSEPSIRRSPNNLNLFDLFIDEFSIPGSSEPGHTAAIVVESLWQEIPARDQVIQLDAEGLRKLRDEIDEALK